MQELTIVLMYPDHLELGFDPDSISALGNKRQAQWEKLQNADFLTQNFH